MNIDSLHRSMVLVSYNGSQFQISTFNFDVPNFHLHQIYTTYEEINVFAYDMGTQKIFWHEGNTVFMHIMLEKKTSTLLTNVSQVSSLKYDQTTKCLFWCSDALNRIESLSLATHKRKTVTEVIGPTHVEIDPVNERLVVTVTGGIVTMEKDGANMRVLKTSLDYADTFIVYKSFPIQTVQKNNTVMLKTFHMDTLESVQSTEIVGHSKAVDIGILDISIYNRILDLCNFENGGCEQVCAFNTTVVCSCTFGYITNGSSCDKGVVENPIIVLSKSEQMLYTMDKNGDTAMVLDIGSVTGLSDLEMDSDNRVVFVAVSSQEKIIQYNITDNTSSTHAFKDIQPLKISFFHSKNEVIFAGKDKSRNMTSVYRYSPSTGSIQKVENLMGEVVDIAVYDKLGYLYVIRAIGGLKPDLLRFNLTTSEDKPPEVIYVPAVQTPICIVIDEIEELLYLVDSKIDAVFRTGLDGRVPQVIFSEIGSGIQDITIDSDYLYVSSKNQRAISRKSKSAEGTTKEVMYPVHLGHVGALQAFYDYYCSTNIGTITVPANCSRRIGDICVIKCQSGFVTLEYNVYVKCGKNALWNASLEICRNEQTPSLTTKPATTPSPEKFTTTPLTTPITETENNTLEIRNDQLKGQDKCENTVLIVLVVLFIVSTIVLGLFVGYLVFRLRRNNCSNSKAVSMSDLDAQYHDSDRLSRPL